LILAESINPFAVLQWRDLGLDGFKLWDLLGNDLASVVPLFPVRGSG
jgi:hypothetical protein